MSVRGAGGGFGQAHHGFGHRQVFLAGQFAVGGASLNDIDGFAHPFGDQSIVGEMVDILKVGFPVCFENEGIVEGLWRLGRPERAARLWSR